MEFINSVIRCFCFGGEDDLHHPNEEVFILFPPSHDQRQPISSASTDSFSDRSSNGNLIPPIWLNDDPFSQRAMDSSATSYICGNKSEIHDSFLQMDCNVLRNLTDLEVQQLLENISDLLQQEVLTSSPSLVSSNDSDFEESSENVEERNEQLIVLPFEVERWINHYSSFQKILLVGEGDFSFSASLAMAFSSAFSSASNVIATSLDSREFLSNNYRCAISNIENLTDKGCRVIHGVDATKMANNPLLMGMKFDRIIFNFPFAGFFKTESRKSQLRRHQQLVSLFLENAKEMINEEGEIHITHKTNGFHSEWNIMPLGFRHGLRLVGTVHFKHTDYPGYSSKCGFGGDNFFNCNPSKTYKILYIKHGLTQK